MDIERCQINSSLRLYNQLYVVFEMFHVRKKYVTIPLKPETRILLFYSLTCNFEPGGCQLRAVANKNLQLQNMFPPKEQVKEVEEKSNKYIHWTIVPIIDSVCAETTNFFSSCIWLSD